MPNAPLVDRIQDALVAAGGSLEYHALAEALYPDKKSWRYQQNGGPPGCYMSLSAGIRRGGFQESKYQAGVRRLVHARPT